MTSGPRKEPMDQKGSLVGPLGGRPTCLVGRPARGPHRLKLDTWRKLIGWVCQFAKDQLQMTPPLAVAPSYKYRGGVEKWNTQHTQLNSPFSLGAWGLHPRCLGSLGGVEEEGESEEESGEVPGLSALFSTCTSTDAYSVVSVRDFLVYLELKFRS